MRVAEWRVAAAALTVALAFGLRLAAALTLPLPLQGDAAAYHGYGQTLSETGRLLEVDGTPLTYRPPGYPAFVGAIYWLGGSLLTVTVAQAMLDSLLVGGVFLFVRTRFSATVALVAALLYAVSPVAIFATGALLSESIGTLLALLAAGMAIRAGESGWKRHAIVAGLACSALTLTRSVMVFFPLALAASCFAALLPRRNRFELGGALVAAYIAGLTPWLARNAYAIGAPTISTNSGATLYASWVHPPGQVWGNNVRDPVTGRADRMTALEADSFLRREAISHVLSNPAGAAGLVPEKIALLLVPLDWEIIGRGRSRSWNPHWFIVAVLAVLAWRLPSFRHSQASLLIVFSFATLLLTSVMFYGSPQFRVPFEALLVLPAAITLASLVRSGGTRAPPANKQSRELTEIPVGHYHRVMESGHPVRQAWHRLKFSRVLELCDGEPGSLLDIGCFAGSLLATATEERFPRQLGVDILPEQIQFASESFGTPYREFRCVETLRDVGFLQESFRYETAVEVIEHLRPDEIRTLFQAAARTLAPGKGQFVLSTPNYHSTWPVLELLLNRISDVDYSEQHITRFTFFNILRRLSRIAPEFTLYFDLEIKTTTHFVSPFLAVFGVGFASRVGSFVPHARWKNPFGNIVLLRLRRNGTPYEEHV